MDKGHAVVELAMAVAVLMLPVALVVASFGPWSERRVFAESTASEAARAAVLDLDEARGAAIASRATISFGLDHHLVRLGWCGAVPVSLPVGSGGCPMSRGTSVAVTVEVWAPLVVTPWGPVGGLWVRAQHVEPVDLYRSFP